MPREEHSIVVSRGTVWFVPNGGGGDFEDHVNIVSATNIDRIGA